jgi:hypothetical protein
MAYQAANGVLKANIGNNQNFTALFEEYII